MVQSEEQSTMRDGGLCAGFVLVRKHEVAMKVLFLLKRMED